MPFVKVNVQHIVVRGAGDFEDFIPDYEFLNAISEMAVAKWGCGENHGEGETISSNVIDNLMAFIWMAAKPDVTPGVFKTFIEMSQCPAVAEARERIAEAAAACECPACTDPTPVWGKAPVCSKVVN